MSVLTACLAAAVISTASAAAAAEVYGRVTASDTGLGIAAAVVALEPEVPLAERAARTDAFGFYRIKELPPGTYTFQASHPAYGSYFTGGLVLAEGQRLRQAAVLLLLDPLEPHFEIEMQVACATSGYRLGGVPVEVKVTPLRGGAGVHQVLVTDANGHGTFAGLPVGLFEFSINEGPNRRPGWEACTRQITQSLHGPHCAEAFLKPEGQPLLAAVYGYDPVSEQDHVLLGDIAVELVGINPDDPEHELVPVQVGTSGIRRPEDPTWDNSMAGLVRFTELGPIHWRLTAKRMGYRPAVVAVKTDAAARLIPNPARLEVALLDTRLTAVLRSPYRDSRLLDGVEVRLQGLTNSNTQGIDRKVTARFSGDARPTAARFERLLPGSYRLMVNEVVTNEVPILVGNQPHPDLSPARFTVRFSGEDVVQAVADEETTVELALEPQRGLLQGQLRLADDERFSPHPGPGGAGHDVLLDYPRADEVVEIRASEYFAEALPPEARLQVVETGADGVFRTTLLPGVYGVVLPALTDYWGAKAVTTHVSLFDPQDMHWARSRWLYYQRWPFDIEAAQEQEFGVLVVSSDRLTTTSLLAHRDRFNLRYGLYGPLQDPAGDEVLALYGQEPNRKTLTRKNRDYERDGTLVLYRGEERISTARQYTNGVFLIERIPPGAGYRLVYEHPRLRLNASATADTFDFEDHEPPGLLPQPESSEGPLPLEYQAASGRLEYPGTGTARLSVWRWHEDVQEYRQVDWDRAPDFLKLDFSGSRTFVYRGATPPSPYEAWVDLSSQFTDGGEHWYSVRSPGGNLEEKLFLGGGPTDTTPAQPLRVAYTLQARAHNGTGRHEELKGVVVRFKEGGQVVAGGTPLTGRTETDEIETVSLPGWDWTMVERLQEVSGNAAVVTWVVYLEQRKELSGVVLNRRTGSPVPMASIQLLKAQGQADDTGTIDPSGPDGAFVYHRELGFEVHFLEVQAPGYAFYRRRLAPETDLAGDGPVVLTGTNAVLLDPLPAPELLTNTISMDRFGAFLPGVSRAGNQSVFNALGADEALTMTWKLQVRSRTNHAQVLPAYDTHDDQAAGTETKTFKDGLAAVWLIDARAFTNNPGSDLPVPLVLPKAEDPHVVLAWLEAIEANAPATPHVFHRKQLLFNRLDSGDLDEVTGTLKLWQLRPEQFTPVFVAVSRLGAVAVHQLQYTGAYAGKELSGMRAPKWLGALSDTLAFVAAAQPFYEERLGKLVDSLPTGRFKPLPSFTADIELAADQSVDYTYALEVRLVEGMPFLGQGLSSLLPGTLGLDLSAGIEAGIKGAERRFSLTVTGGAGVSTANGTPAGAGTPQKPEAVTRLSAKNVTRSAYRPSFPKFLRLVDPSLDPPPNGTLSHITSQVFDPLNQPTELSVTHAVEGEIGTLLKVNLVPALGVIPVIGQTLVALNQAEQLSIDAFLRAAIAVKSSTTWYTRFPSEFEHRAVPFEPGEVICVTEVPTGTGGGGLEGRDCRVLNQPRRHFLGGDEWGPNSSPTNSFELCFNGAIGIRVDLLGGRLGAKGSIQVAGTNCFRNTPALLCVPNPLGDWPPIRRVQGDLRLVFEMYIDAWVVKYQKRWDQVITTIDHQFGTETQFYLWPMDITVSTVRATDFDPATFDRRGPQVLRNVMPLATYSAAGNGGLAFVDMLPGREEMGLQFSLRAANGTWSEPVLVARSSGAIIDTCLLPTPDGKGWMAVWTEVPVAHVGDDYPPSVVWYATLGGEGSRWSDPLPVAELPDVANELCLVRYGDGLALVFLRTDEGLGARNYEAAVAFWTGQAWGAPQRLLGAESIAGFAVVGTTDASRLPLHFVFVDETATLYALGWDGQAASAPQVLGQGAGQAMALTEAPRAHCLAWSQRDGGIGFFRFTEAAPAWADQGIAFPGVAVQALETICLADGDNARLLTVWTGGGNPSALSYGFADLTGRPLGAAVDLTVNSRGHYHQPNLLAADGRRCTVLARFSDDPTEELREFALAYPEGLVNGDRDQDGMNDVGELLVVDADPLDLVRTIDEVRPQDDFDQDGFPNGRELGSGSDPGDAGNHPSLQVLLEPGDVRGLGAQWRIEGGDWLASGAAMFLRPGQYQLEFREVAGWSTPRSRLVEVTEGEAANVIIRYVQGGVSFEAWAGNLDPALPPGREGPDHLNGTWGLPNFVAYALGSHPLEAEADTLPRLELQGSELVYTYRLSKTALDVAYRIAMAPEVAAEVWQEMPDGVHTKVGETSEAELWQFRVGAPAALRQAFLRFEVLRLSE